jgi:bacteriocin biosynthesis cyclodehydratase domain-containing protein
MDLPELDGLHRPRWRPAVPALWRDQTTLQLGDDVIVDRVTPAHLEWLRRLDGLHTCLEVTERLPIPLTEARRLVRALHSAGALVDAAQAPDAARWADRAGRDLLAQQFDTLMSVHRDPIVAGGIMRDREAARIAIVGEGSLRNDTAQAVSAAGLTEVASVDKATLIVLADAHHPDVPAHFDHAAMDRPHLHIGAHAHRATVGPLVVPGRTSCLRCAHLHLRDSDRAWPVLAVQWSQAVGSRPRSLDALLSRSASTHAAALLQTWVDTPERPDLWADQAWELELPHMEARRVARPPHPLCGCLWEAT